MQLTRHTDYALRVLMYLSINKEGLATISDIAQAYDISRNHLVKIVHELAGHGFVQTYRGKSGGMRLALAPEEIGVGDVVRRMEGTLEVVNCTGPRCAILPDCRLRGVLTEARDAFLAVLDGYTLRDLIARRENRLVNLLGAQ